MTFVGHRPVVETHRLIADETPSAGSHLSADLPAGEPERVQLGTGRHFALEIGEAANRPEATVVVRR